MSKESSGVLTLAKQGGITFIGNILDKILGFAFIMMVTRMVSPDVFGTFTLALSIVIFAQNIFSLNLYRAIDYFVPQSLTEERFGRANSTVLTVIAMAGMGSVLGYLLLNLVAPKLSQVFSTEQLTVVIPVIGVSVLLITLNKSLLSCFNSVKILKYRVYTKNLIQKATKFVVALVLLWLGWGVWGLVYAQIAAFGLSVVAGAYFLTRSQDWLSVLNVERPRVGEIVTYSVPLMFAGIIYATVGQIDFFIIGYFHGSRPVGLYKVGYSLASNLLIVIAAVSPVFKPMISERKNDIVELKKQYWLATRWVFMLTFPMAVTLFTAPAAYLSILFSPEYAVVGLTLSVLTMGYLVNAFFGPQSMMLQGLGYTRLTLLNTVIMITVNSLLDFALVPSLGPLGAGIGTAAAISTFALAGAIQIKITKGIHPFDTDMLKQWVAGGASFLSALGLRFSADGVVLASVLPFLVVAVYLTSLLLLKGLSEEELILARKLDSYLGTTLLEKTVSAGVQ
ncbi:MAG: flippase [Halobacteria archaeon]